MCIQNILEEIYFYFFTQDYVPKCNIEISNLNQIYKLTYKILITIC